ncbi:MAG: GntR family transcriptional regulator [Rhodobacteraceae bacterium]|nr:GntR family transcriptional regulator [Paracoccaceae bacterium]
MTTLDYTEFLTTSAWHRPGEGPRYLQLGRHLSEAIRDGRLAPDTPLPPERDLADMAEVSRVTVRKAIGQLAASGLIDQRQGSGSFVRPQSEGPRLQQSLSALTSFTEYMEHRGMTSSSVVLETGLYTPTPQETVTLGLTGEQRVARIRRLRSADGAPLAIETSSLPEDILPDPGAVETSLYKVLREAGGAPVRALQRLNAANASADEAAFLDLPEGTAVLQIERTGYLASGRPIEFTRGLYRGDIYDFVAELRLD